jgi:hypothetical protein
MIEHQVHSDALAYQPEYRQSDCGFSHLKMSMYIYGCCMWERRTIDCEILYVIKFTTLIALSLMISCKLSFPIVGLKNVFPAHFGTEIS